MNTIKHFLINAIVASVISKLTLGYIDMYFFWIVSLSGVLIDLDHFFVAVYTGLINHPRKLLKYWWHITDKRVKAFYIFHTFEFTFLMILIGIMFNNFVFLFIAIGLLLHLIGDAITNTIQAHGLSWVSDYSLLYIVFFIKR